MTDPLRLAARHTAKLAAEIAAIKGEPQELPSQPFSRALALWLCRTCSYWNAPERVACKDCGTVRP